MADDSVDYRNDSAGGRDGGTSSPAPREGTPDTTPNRILTTSGGRARVCRQVYSVSVARWRWAYVYCGDRAGIEVVILGYPPQTAVTINVIHLTEDNRETQVDTVNANLVGGRIDAEWIAKGNSAATLSGKYIFRITTALLDNPIVAVNILILRRISDLPKTHYSSGRDHFDLTVAENALKIESDIEYIKGWGGSVVKFGNAVPAATGGTIAGFTITGGYRWMKAVGVTNKYWDGEAWQAMPEGFALQDSNNFAVGFYKSGDNYLCQYGGTWPESFADYSITSDTNRAIVNRWKDNIRTTWTGKHRIKRSGCPSNVPECCRFSVSAKAEFVSRATFAAGMLIIAVGNIRSNDSLLFLGEPRVAVAGHEFGHHLGNPDEYAGARVEATLNDDGAVNGIDADSIMGQNLTKVKKRHYRKICIHLQGMVTTASTRRYTYAAIDL